MTKKDAAKKYLVAKTPIRCGRYLPERIGVSRSTVLRAISELEREGIVEIHRAGKNTRWIWKIIEKPLV